MWKTQIHVALSDPKLGKVVFYMVAALTMNELPPAVSPVLLLTGRYPGSQVRNAVDISLDISPSHDCSQWLFDMPILAYRCGGSAGISPASRLTVRCESRSTSSGAHLNTGDGTHQICGVIICLYSMSLPFDLSALFKL